MRTSMPQKVRRGISMAMIADLFDEEINILGSMLISKKYNEHANN